MSGANKYWMPDHCPDCRSGLRELRGLDPNCKNPWHDSPALPELLEKARAKLPIDRPCSACSAGDYDMQHHDHAPPFRVEGAQPEPVLKCIEDLKYPYIHSGEMEAWNKAITRCLEILRASSSPAPSPASQMDYSMSDSDKLGYLVRQTGEDTLINAVIKIRKWKTGVTGNEGKDESRGKDNAVDSGAHAGDRVGSAGTPLSEVASPAVVTPEQFCQECGHDGCDCNPPVVAAYQKWSETHDWTKHHAPSKRGMMFAEAYAADLRAKVSELEAQLQQARAVIDNKTGIIEALCRGGKAERKALRELQSAKLERMRAGGKQ